MNKNFRTDLATEVRSEYMKEYAQTHDGEPDGIIYTEKEEKGIKISTLEITNQNGEKILSKPIGKYITVNVGKLWLCDYDKFKRAADEIAKIIREIGIEDESGRESVLVCGLGNRYITADAVGAIAAKNIIITRHIKEKERIIYDAAGLGDICAISPGVLAQTGIESYEQIKGAIKLTKPTIVVIIDALAAKNIENLATTVQLTDTGISPGSGVANDRGELSERTLGVKTVAIGIPTVIDTDTLLWNILEESTPNEAQEMFDKSKRKMKNTFVCPKDTDVAVEEMSRLVGFAINRAFHKKMSYDEMMYF